MKKVLKHIEKAVGIAVLLILLTNPIKAEAAESEVPDTVSFPEYGITEIKIPEGMCVVTSGDAFCDVPFPEERKAEFINYTYEYDNVLLYLLSSNSDINYGVFFYEMDHPIFSEEDALISEEDYQAKYSNQPESRQNIKIDRLYLNDTFCKEFTYYDTNSSGFWDVYYIYTKVGDKYYEIEIRLFSYLNIYSEDEAELLKDLVANATFNESTMKDSFDPVPATIDFPEYGIYNVTVPKGFSLFTADEMFIDPEFYIKHYIDIENTVNSFKDNPARVARIINSDYTYEIDLKVNETLSKLDLFLQYGIADLYFQMLYPSFYDSKFLTTNIKRGDIYGKYGIEADSYDTERDFYFHLLDYKIVYDGGIHDIDYHLNSYGGPIDSKMDNLFIDTAKNLTFDEVFEPQQENNSQDSKGIFYYIKTGFKAIINFCFPGNN